MLSITVAQNTIGSYGVASYVVLIDKNVQDGSIISSTGKGFSLSQKAYDHSIFGVVNLKPAILFDLKNVPAGSYPIVTSGQVEVLVNGENGAIKKGDVITASSTKGIGMKAVRSGVVLGYSLADFTPKKPSDITRVPLLIKIFSYTTESSISSSFWDIFNLSQVAATEEPIRAFQYLMAALVLILSLLLGFASFSRLASRGVEALGRNPLAARIIQVGIVLNIILTMMIVVAGIIVAFFIVRL